MTIEKILDECYPLTPQIQSSIIEKEFWLYKRERLRKMIERYRAGELIDFEPLKISIDIDELLKRRFN